MSKIPTDTQWADLASKINGKQDLKDYSTTEQDTGIKWIDGRTIYKKTINCGKGPNIAQKDTQTGVTGIDFVTKIEGVLYNSTASIFMGPAYLAFSPGSTALGSGCISLGYVKSTNVVRVTTNGDRSGFNCYVTIWYCKASS